MAIFTQTLASITMNKESFRKNNFIGEKYFQGFIQIIFILLSFGVFLVELSNFNKDTALITNFGFAILLGLASISFSWSRAVFPENIERKKKLLTCGTHALYGSIIFLVGSAIKYATMPHGIEYLNFLSDDSSFWVYIPRSLAFICFLYAIMKTNVVIPGLLKIIAQAHDEDLKEEIEEEKKQN